MNAGDAAQACGLVRPGSCRSWSWAWRWPALRRLAHCSSLARAAPWFRAPPPRRGSDPGVGLDACLVLLGICVVPQMYSDFCLRLGCLRIFVPSPDKARVARLAPPGGLRGLTFKSLAPPVAAAGGCRLWLPPGDPTGSAWGDWALRVPSGPPRCQSRPAALGDPRHVPLGICSLLGPALILAHPQSRFTVRLVVAAAITEI